MPVSGSDWLVSDDVWLTRKNIPVNLWAPTTFDQSFDRHEVWVSGISQQKINTEGVILANIKNYWLIIQKQYHPKVYCLGSRDGHLQTAPAQNNPSFLFRFAIYVEQKTVYLETMLTHMLWGVHTGTMRPHTTGPHSELSWGIQQKLGQLMILSEEILRLPQHNPSTQASTVCVANSMPGTPDFI